MLIVCQWTVVDSTLLAVSVEDAHVSKVVFEEPIIDHIFDDFLYICTSDNLYKIDPSVPVLVDKTRLPLRFNYVMLRDREIMLISTDEIIVLNRSNLAFKSGIGLTHGDSRPLIKNQSFAALSVRNNIYLASDVGRKTAVRILDARSGKLIRKRTLDRVKSFKYDPRTQSFVGLDIGDNILIYDMNMTQQRKIKLPVHARSCTVTPNGFLIDFDEGLLLIDQHGGVIDFQPIPLARGPNGSLFLYRDAIVGLDSTAMRTNGWFANTSGIIELYDLAKCNHELGIDAHGNLYLVRQQPISVEPLTASRTPLTRISAAQLVSDSIWYFQLAAFSNLTNALGVYDEFRQTGLPVFIDSTELYRIKFGGFKDKFDGLEIADKLKLNGWFVYENKVPGVNSGEFHIGTEKYIIQDGLIRRE
jgi:hypothetical protein